MKPDIKIIALSAAMIFSAAASRAGAQASATQAVARRAAGGSPVAFCCNAYDNVNGVGQQCSPVAVTTGANYCSTYYFECNGAFLCGPASLVDPSSGVSTLGAKGPVLPDCECGT
ncbi:MAG TPA: hypothetical protein VHY56_10460, partial [Candidatus Binataceae bacterium]|nr:hypothetical protein [Candidatus Binataceae bacterium]